MERFRCGMPYRALAAWLTVIGVAAAQIPQGVPEAAESPVKPASTSAGATAELASPQHTMRTFLDAANRAFEGKQQAHTIVASTMDAPPGVDRLQIARHLMTVFNRLGRIDVNTMLPGPDDVAAEKLTQFEFFPQNARAQDIIRPATKELGEPPGRIVLARDGSGAWRFTRQTVEDVYRLANWIQRRELQYGVDTRGMTVSSSIRRRIPAMLKDRYFLSLEYWQWVGLLIVLFLSVASDLASRIVLAVLVRRTARRLVGDPEAGDVGRTVRPLGLAVGAIVFLVLVVMLGLPPTASSVLFVAGRMILVVGLTWAAWSATDLAAEILRASARKTDTTFDDMLIPLGRKSLRLFIVAMGILYVAEAFNIELAPLLGGLGLAGLAVSFAAQDIVKNVFGGITIFLDRPFKIGERINFQGHDGIVEEIGFRTTRLRTLTGHLVTIPNGLITNETVENIAKRPYIRRLFHVTITYDTPREKVQQAVETIRSILQENGLREPIHPEIDGNPMPPRVYFSDYGATSLDIVVIYWFAPPLYWDYMEHAEKFNLRLFEAFESLGVEFAFPTQTVYLAGDPNRELTVKTS